MPYWGWPTDERTKARRTKTFRHLISVLRRSSAYSQLILDQLERANLFVVPLDDDRQWYRYHHLFAEVLRHRLTSGVPAETVATLHRRASVWYERQGLVAEAVQHAQMAADNERATI